MGGRIYDPTIARFLNPDPFVQEQKNIQNFNKYSYVLNNPYGFTDPTGYFFNSVGNWFKMQEILQVTGYQVQQVVLEIGLKLQQVMLESGL